MYAAPAASACSRQLGAGVHHDAGSAEAGQHLGQERLGDRLVDEEGLRRVADAGPLGLGVDDDALGDVEVGSRVDVDVVDADPRLDDRHRGLGHHGLDEVGAAAGDHEVDEAAGGHERPGGVVAAAVEQAYRVLVDPQGHQGFAHHTDQRAVARRGRRTATKDHRVAALEAERRGVHRDVGAGLVDHPDDAHRHAHLADLQPVGQRRTPHDLADRVGQRRDVADRLGDRPDASLVEGEPVEQSLGEALVAATFEVLGVRGDDLVGRRDQAVGDRVQGLVLRRAREQRELSGRPSGTLRKRFHLLDRGRVDSLGGHVPRVRRARAAPPLGYRVKGLYALKPWYSRRLGLFVDLAVRRGISPDVFTALGVLGAALAAVVIWQGWWPLALLFLAVRLGGANLDGAVARARGVSRPWGFVLNEVGDRVSDLLMYAGLAALAARVTGSWTSGFGRLDAARRARRDPPDARLVGGRRGRRDTAQRRPARQDRALRTGRARDGGPRLARLAGALVVLGSVVTAALRLRAAHAELRAGGRAP